MLLRNHIRDVWDPRYDVAYCVVCVMRQQLKLADQSGKIHRGNVQNIKVTYPVDELKKMFTQSKSFWTCYIILSTPEIHGRLDLVFESKGFTRS